LKILYILLILFFVGGFSFIPASYASHFIVTESGLQKTDSVNSSISDEDYLTRPTFGLDHKTNSKVVDYGFKLNDQRFSIDDNFHTPFEQKIIDVGKTYSFEATVFSKQGLLVQEFLFGIPSVGEAHMAEVGVEVWFDNLGQIQMIKVIQDSGVIDENEIVATHEKTKCKSIENEENCDSTKIEVVFLEPLQDKIMAIKAIDSKNRYQITYLNEGIDVSGKSLNPMKTTIIPSPKKNEEPIMVMQTEKYSVLWTTEDGRIFERNTFGSFKQINQSFERFQDSGEPLTRSHSDFIQVIENERSRMVKIFNATNLISKLPESFTYSFPDEHERITDEVRQKMIEQEKIAQKIIEESSLQARFSNTLFEQ